MKPPIRLSRYRFLIPLILGAGISIAVFIAVKWMTRTGCTRTLDWPACEELHLNAMMLMTTVWAVTLVVAALQWWSDADAGDARSAP